jgi:hypothetical protein
MQVEHLSGQNVWFALGKDVVVSALHVYHLLHTLASIERMPKVVLSLDSKLITTKTTDMQKIQQATNQAPMIAPIILPYGTCSKFVSCRGFLAITRL